MKKDIQTQKAPQPIGAYSQAIEANGMLYVSGQIPLHPETLQIVEGEMRVQVARIFDNLKGVAEAAGISLNHVVKLTVYLTDITHASVVNDVMQTYFQTPYPARTTIAVAALPKNAAVEIDAIAVMDNAHKK